LGVCLLPGCASDDAEQVCPPIGCPSAFNVTIKPAGGKLSSGSYEIDLTVDGDTETRNCEVPKPIGQPPCKTASSSSVAASVWADESGLQVNFSQAVSSVTVSIKHNGEQFASGSFQPVYTSQPLDHCTMTCKVAPSETITI
jgi:hypothetical protein